LHNALREAGRRIGAKTTAIKRPRQAGSALWKIPEAIPA
ncbi:MAG: hypothetical protein ACJAVK_001056, partial [Akkermansiaceae bacterium]